MDAWVDGCDGWTYSLKTDKEIIIHPPPSFWPLQALLSLEEVCTGHFFPHIFVRACCFPLILNGRLFWVLPPPPRETSIKQTTVWVEMWA